MTRSTLEMCGEFFSKHIFSNSFACKFLSLNQTTQNDRTYSMILHLPGSEQYFHLQNNKQNNYHSIFLNVQNDKKDTCKVQTLKSAPIQFVRIVALRATSAWVVSCENLMKHAVIHLGIQNGTY